MSGRAGAGGWFATFVGGRRGEILDAALGVFASKGYDAGTMREIASAVGISEPALYRYWPGKEALFDDLVALAGDRVVGQARDVLALVSPGTVRASLDALLGAPEAGADRRLHFMRAVVVAAPSRPAIAEACRSHLALPMLDVIAETVARLDAEMGVARAPGELDSCARILMSVFVGHTFTTMMLGDPGSRAATVAAALAVLRWDEAV